MNLRLPSLRERPDDIPVLAEFFANKYAEANGQSPRPISKAAVAKLSSHDWPGNVRELENTMHRAVLIAIGGEIGEEAITQQSTPGASTGATAQNNAGNDMVGRTVADVERQLIVNTLQHCLGNRTHAANILGISILHYETS